MFREYKTVFIHFTNRNYKENSFLTLLSSNSWYEGTVPVTRTNLSLFSMSHMLVMSPTMYNLWSSMLYTYEVIAVQIPVAHRLYQTMGLNHSYKSTSHLSQTNTWTLLMFAFLTRGYMIKFVPNDTDNS